MKASPTNPQFRTRPVSAPCQAAFTLTELLAVLVVIVIIGTTLATGMASSRSKAQSLRCLDNLRQVIGALEMFGQDHQDLLPPNPDDGTTQPGYTWCAGQAGIGGPDEFDPDILADPTRCSLAPYLGTNVSVFRCTADNRVGLYDGGALYPASPLKGTKVLAARTISMSQAVGTIDSCFARGGGHCGVPNLPVNGPWLTGSYGANRASTGPFHTYGKFSDMVVPTPAQLIVVTEEAPLSINDGSLAASANVGQSAWIDFPSTLHNNGCVLSFGDGHVELHKWVGTKIVLTSPPSQPVVPPTDPDWLWCAQRISAKL